MALSPSGNILLAANTDCDIAEFDIKHLMSKAEIDLENIFENTDTQKNEESKKKKLVQPTRYFVLSMFILFMTVGWR